MNGADEGEGGDDGDRDDNDGPDGTMWEDEIINPDPAYTDTCWDKTKRGMA